MTCSRSFLIVVVFGAILPLNLVIAAATSTTDDEGQQCSPTESDSCSSTGVEPEAMTERRREAPLPLLDGLFPDQSLDGAWEVHPLLSTVYPNLRSGRRRRRDDGAGVTSGVHAGTTNGIPTVVAPDEGAAGSERRSTSSTAAAPSVETRHPTRLSSVRSLFHLDDVSVLLSQPNLVHTEDFQMVKKIIRDGQEWMGMLPQKSLPPDEARRHFDLGGFSLVVNRLQRRWRPVFDYARQVQNETGCNYVSVNMYLTPDTHDRTGRGESILSRSGFEAHWDWMDVIVVQLSGAKLWSVAREPTVYLSTHDMKRKPTPEEMEKYAHVGVEERGGRYDDFVLRPGDALYIPRGFVHNASTVDPQLLGLAAGVGAGGDGEDADDGFLGYGPSLHLTFGVEHSIETTYEGLVHHALEALDESGKGWGGGAGDEANDNDRIAISGSNCGIDRDVMWTVLLHFVVGDVARTGCRSGREGACQLLRSVPRGTAWVEIARERQRRRSAGGAEKEEEEEDESDSSPNDPILDSLLDSINAVADLGNLHTAAAFVSHLLAAREAEEEVHYHIPTVSGVTFDEMRCIVGLAGSDISPSLLRRRVQRLGLFAEENYHEVTQRFEGHLAVDLATMWERDDGDLIVAGQ